MEWKRIKTTLIILLLAVNVFLCYQIYNRYQKDNFNQEAYLALTNILKSRSIQLESDIKKVNTTKRVQRLLIKNDLGFLEDFTVIAPNFSIKGEKYIGKRKRVISTITLLSNFIRDVKPHDITISNINSGYFYDNEKIEEGVVSGEAVPVWLIDVTPENQRYIYNAYTGEIIKTTSSL